MNRRAHHPTRRHTRPPKLAGDARAQRPSGDVVPEALTDFDLAAADRPSVPFVTDKVTRPKAIERVAINPEAVPNHQVADDVIPTDHAVAQIEPPSISGAVAAHPSPTPPALTGGPVQPRTGEAEHFGCTAPQLRRFIKRRTYVPMHELRRRFGIEGGDDDVTAVDVDRERRVFVGLPTREGRLLGELFRAGDVGYELSLDPISPIVVGVFPMRPVARG